MPKVLIIEDDLIMVKLLTSALADVNCEIVVAFDGLQGSTVAQNQRPDLIILDLIMPLGGGITVLRNLRMSAHTKTTPVIVLSGTSDEALIDQAKNLGIEAFFPKPFDREPVVAKIQEILAR